MNPVLWLCPSFPTETLKWLSSLPILMQESFWWWQCSDRYIISLCPTFPTFSPSLINLMVSVDVKHHVYFKCAGRARELCGSRGCRPVLVSLVSLQFLWTKSNIQPNALRLMKALKRWGWQLSDIVDGRRFESTSAQSPPVSWRLQIIMSSVCEERR